MDYSFFDSLIDAVFVVNEKRQIQYVNEAGATLLQSSVRRLTKGEGAEIYNLCEISKTDSFLMESGIDGKEMPSPWEEVDIKILKSNFEGKVQVAIQPFSDPDGQSRWVITLHDVTLEETLHQKYQGELEQREEMIQQLQEARAQLEAYSKNLEQMVEERTQEVRQANHMLKAIMNSLGQGFLVFDSEGVCGNVFTKACEDILESVPEGHLISEVLKIPEGQKDQFKNWKSATFSQALPFDSMKDLAPQKFEHSQGKYVTLDYFPLNEEGSEKLSHVVLVATDKTSEHEANLALEKERDYAKMIVKLIRNRRQFAEFFHGIDGLIDEIKSLLSAGEGVDFDLLFRYLHTLEGEAGAFHVQSVRYAAREFQEIMEPYRSGDKEFSKLSQAELLSQVKKLDQSRKNFLKENEEIFSVVSISGDQTVDISTDQLEAFFMIMKNSGVKRDILEQFEQEFLKQDLIVFLRHLDDLAQTVAEKQGKQLNPVHFKTNDIKVFPDQLKNFFSSLVHAFRNSVDHGLETPEEREQFSKPMAGNIQVVVESFDQLGSHWLRFIINDDGRGIDPNVIKAKVEENMGSGYLREKNDQEIIQQIFEPGFSSRDTVTEFSGRGVGMDAIKTEVVALGGKVWVDSHLGQGTKITIEIPNESSQNKFAESA